MQVSITKEQYILGGSVISALGVGFVAGHFVAHKRLQAHYIQVALEEIEDAKEFYRRQLKVEEYSDPQDLAEHYMEPEELDPSELEEKVEELGYRNVDESMERFPMVVGKLEGIPDDQVVEVTVEEIEETDTTIEHSSNVFEKDEEDKENGWDFEAELEHRKELDEGAPYILHQDEFDDGEHGYSQVSVTYFEADGVLTDERDMPIDEIEATVGHDNLDRFGHGSRDENVVYVRNDRLGVDFEVTRSPGSFAEEVHGAIIRHSSDRPRKVRKMRNEDD